MPAPKFISHTLADTLSSVARKQLEDGLKFRAPRLQQVQKYEDAYMNKTPRTLKRRMNVPLPVMSGFVDTLIAKVDDPPTVNYNPTELADLKKSRKVTSMWQVDSSPTRGMWDIKDILVKKLAAFSGRGIFEIFAESSPTYKHHLEITDPFDFVCEPGGGWHLENHLFLGKTNVFRTKAELTEGVNNGWYDGAQVTKLLNSQSQLTDKEKEEAEQRASRMKALGLNLEAHSDVGQDVYNFATWGMVYNGIRYYLMFEPKTGIWIRAHKLDEIFKKKKDEPSLWPWVSWATHYDAWNFWSKAPADDVYPIHEAMRVVFNEGLMNLRRRNWNMRAVDTDIFPDLNLLEWREDGIVPSTASLKGKRMSEGIYEFDTPDTTSITVNLTNFLNDFLGQKSGITGDVQGVSDPDQKVGVFFGQLQQVADRLGLLNKFYKQAWAELGQRYVRGLRQHATSGIVVKMTGTEEYEEFEREDANPISDFDIQITGGQAQVQLDEIKKKQKAESLALAVKSYPQEFNPRTTSKFVLENGGWEHQEIRTLMDTRNEADQEILSEADQAVQDMLAGKKPRMNRGATTAFIQYIIDWATDNVPMDKPELFNALMEYAQAHVQIAEQNVARKIALTEGVEGGLEGAPEGPGEVDTTTAGSFVNELPPGVAPRPTARGTVRSEEVPVG